MRNDLLPTASIRHRCKSIVGLSLIEVLVAVVLFGIGIMSVSSLQLLGLKSSSGNHIRTQAELMAGDILERMRANRPNASSYQIGMNDQAPSNAKTIAETDLQEWKQQLASLLPNGNGSIVFLNNRATISISWTAKDNQRDNNSATETLNMSSEL